MFVNKLVFNLVFFKWKSNDTKIAGFHSITLVKMWQVPQKLLNDQFKNVITQKVIITKFAKNYRVYVKMKQNDKKAIY